METKTKKQKQTEEWEKMKPLEIVLKKEQRVPNIGTFYSISYDNLDQIPEALLSQRLISVRDVAETFLKDDKRGFGRVMEYIIKWGGSSRLFEYHSLKRYDRGDGPCFPRQSKIGVFQDDGKAYFVRSLEVEEYFGLAKPKDMERIIEKYVGIAKNDIKRPLLKRSVFSMGIEELGTARSGRDTGNDADNFSNAFDLDKNDLMNWLFLDTTDELSSNLFHLHNEFWSIESKKRYYSRTQTFKTEIPYGVATANLVKSLREKEKGIYQLQIEDVLYREWIPNYMPYSGGGNYQNYPRFSLDISSSRDENRFYFLVKENDKEWQDFVTQRNVQLNAHYGFLGAEEYFNAIGTGERK